MIKYPDGKVAPDDEGALQAKCFIKNDRVIIDFGKSLSWIALDEPSLRMLVDMLTIQLDNLQRRKLK